MTDITPKRTSEAWRSYVVRTRAWPLIAEHYRTPLSPMLHLADAIAASSVAAQIHGATSLAELLLSDCPDFRIGDSTLRISCNSADRTFHFCHHSFSGHDDEKTCSESEVLKMLSLFLKLKYSILFELPPTIS